MATEAVGLRLDERRPVPPASPGDGFSSHLADLHDVHAVNMHTWHAKSWALFVDEGLFVAERGPRGTQVLHADCPLIVLHNKDAWQLVQGGHVEALIKLANVARAVAEKVDADLIGRLISKGSAAVGSLKRCAQADWNPLTDKGITTQLWWCRLHV